MLGYALTAYNELCPENTNSTIYDLTTCKEAAAEFSYPFKRTGHGTDRPKGCYQLNYGVYFNQHVNGSAHSRARQICKGGGN